MIKLSLAELSSLLAVPAPEVDTIFTGVSTDTRTLVPGNLFIPIKGEQYDGHDFIAEAIKKGASAVLISKNVTPSIPHLFVTDTLLAFGKMSAVWRNRFQFPIVGVTGSNGKTTLKNMIATILKNASEDSSESVLATEGNLNNNIGVPLMLCRLQENHHFAVIEMGMNHFGEIAYLTQLTQPQVAIVNNAAESHLEGLGSVAGVAQAKGEIFSGLSANGTAILNRDDAFYEYWRGLVSKHHQLSFGFHPDADVHAKNIAQTFTVHTPQGEMEVRLPLLGKHNIKNALAATAASLALGMSLATIKKGLEQVRPAHGRMESYYLANGACVIDDTYNANPFSLNAAVETLVDFKGTKIVVLGDMKELGTHADELHAVAGEKMRADIQYLFTLGELSAATAQAFGKNARHFTDREQLIAALQPHLQKDVTILVKGSRSMRMEKILAAIIPAEQFESAH